MTVDAFCFLIQETLLLLKEKIQERSEWITVSSETLPRTEPKLVNDQESSHNLVGSDIGGKQSVKEDANAHNSEKLLTHTRESKNSLRRADPLVVKPKEALSTRAAAQDQMLTTLSHASSSLRLLPKPADVYLVYFEKESLKFLESVAVAINQQLTTAELLFCKDEKEFQKLLQTPFLKLALVANDSNEVHKIKGKVLTIAKASHYSNDPQLKRALWNLLKSQFSPPSSSTLRSTKL